MTRRPAAFTQADITRAIRGARAGGLDVRSCRITADGDILISTATEPDKPDPYAAWKAQRDAKGPRDRQA